jgi:G6PDH family F420-dependent oxidoreductase
MAKIGYFLSCEQLGPKELIDQAKRAEAAGFDGLWISDHFHPWNDEQRQSPFVWSVIGALSEVTPLPVTTAVTCPTVRIHPAIIAQAAATAAVQLGGLFALGVGRSRCREIHPANGAAAGALNVGCVRALRQRQPNRPRSRRSCQTTR